MLSLLVVIGENFADGSLCFSEIWLERVVDSCNNIETRRGTNVHKHFLLSTTLGPVRSPAPSDLSPLVAEAHTLRHA